VRKRTQAKQRSDARGPTAGPRHGGRSHGQQVVANIRKNSLARRPGPNQDYPPPQGTAPLRYDNAGPEGYPRQGSPLPQQVPPISPGLPMTQPGSLPDPNGYFPPQRQQQQPLGQSQLQYEPPINNPGGPGGYPSPRIPSQRPPSQPQLGAPGQPGRRIGRGGSYNGSGFPPPGGPPSFQQPQQGRVRTPSPPASSEPPARPAPGKGPATFQEMGYQSQKLEEKDCVIM
jgi:hypothetical protein